MDNRQKDSSRNYPPRNGAPANKSQEGRDNPSKFLNDYPFDENWIKVGADEKMVEFANKAGEYMAPKDNRDKQMLSKSQIRNVFGELKRIQLKGIDKQEGYTSFMLLKPKVAYAEGRNRTMGLTLFKLIFDKAWEKVGREQNSYNNFCALIEAVLAYHKAYGGKD